MTTQNELRLKKIEESYVRNHKDEFESRLRALHEHVIGILKRQDNSAEALMMLGLFGLDLLRFTACFIAPSSRLADDRAMDAKYVTAAGMELMSFLEKVINRLEEGEEITFSE